MPQQTTVFKITLTPLERFFFGGENVFGTEGQQSERRRSYLVESNILPQQTTLLGALRYQLLAQNNLLLNPKSTPKEVNDAIELVGSSGFSAVAMESFGLIHGLSPLYLCDDSGAIWHPAPLDDVQVKDKDGHEQPIQFDMEGNHPVLRNLNPKTGLSLQYGNDKILKHRKPLTSFFRAYSQVGITMKNRIKHAKLSEEEREEAYYFQTFRKNTVSQYAEAIDRTKQKEIHSFVFYAKLDNKIANYRFQDEIINMGGENSTFKMTVESTDWSDINEKLLPVVSYSFNQLGEPSTIKRIVLQSDTYAEWPLVRDNSLLVVSNTVPFRYFTTYLGKTRNFIDLKKNDVHSRGQSGLFTLLERGSVIYTNDQTKHSAITDHLIAQTAFRQIGYNYFQIL